MREDKLRHVVTCKKIVFKTKHDATGIDICKIKWQLSKKHNFWVLELKLPTLLLIKSNNHSKQWMQLINKILHVYQSCSCYWKFDYFEKGFCCCFLAISIITPLIKLRLEIKNHWTTSVGPKNSGLGSVETWGRIKISALIGPSESLIPEYQKSV